MNKGTKVALITGASRNIGKAICRKFYENGYKVIGTCSPNDISDMDIFVAEFPNATLIPVDFCDDSQVTEFINAMKKYHFDVIVNNAGMLDLDGDNNVVNEFVDFNYDVFRKVFTCNFFTPLRICLELKSNINNGGSIVNIASGAGTKATYATMSYNASKAALINLSASLSNSFYPHNSIRVNCVSPGWVTPDTDGGMNMDSTSPGYKAMNLTPIGRNGSTIDIANVVWALAQKDMEFINGANIPVDGGFSNHDVIYYEEATGKQILQFD